MRGTNKVKVSISFPINKWTMPEYFDETSSAYVDIHAQLEALEQAGLISLVWKGNRTGHILEKCLLQPAKLREIYARLGRTPKTEKETVIRQLIQEFYNEGEIETESQKILQDPLQNFCQYLFSRIDRGESIKAYADLDDPEGLRRLLTLIQAILNHRDKPDSFLREFSIETFHDSKLAEPEIVKAAHIIRDFAENANLKELEADDLLSEFNIYRNPSQIMMKGTGTIRIGHDEEITLSTIPGGIAITNEAVPTSEWIGSVRSSLHDTENHVSYSKGVSCESSRKDEARELDLPAESSIPEIILTIENLTSYYRFHATAIDGKPVLCLYLGGYVNHIRRDFLHKIYEAFPEATYLHFGDIDCGGFRIYRHLRESTEIPFKPYLMDLETFREYEQYGRKLSENDEKLLKQMLEDSFYKDEKALFEAMLQDHCKLEQECIEVEG